MPPEATNVVECTGVLDECDAETVDGALDKNVAELKHANKRELKLVWRNIILFAVVHLSAVYGLWLVLTSARIYTSLFGKKTPIFLYPIFSIFPELAIEFLFVYRFFLLQLWFYILYLDWELQPVLIVYGLIVAIKQNYHFEFY